MNSDPRPDEQVLERLRQAVRKLAPDADMESRLRRALQQQARRERLRIAAFTLAAVVLALGVGALYQRSIGRISSPVVSAAFDAHRFCLQARDPHALLSPAVLEALRPYIPPGFQLLLAHHCRYEGASLIHAAIGDGVHELSVVLVDSRSERPQTGDSRLAGLDAQLFPVGRYQGVLVSDPATERRIDARPLAEAMAQRVDVIGEAPASRLSAGNQAPAGERRTRDRRPPK